MRWINSKQYRQIIDTSPSLCSMSRQEETDLCNSDGGLNVLKTLTTLVVETRISEKGINIIKELS